MTREQAGTGHADRIRISPFRHCSLSADKVELTHPLILGSGFVFDRTRQTVTVRRCLLGHTLSKQEIPFSDISTVCLRRHEQVNTRGNTAAIQRAIEMEVADGRTFTIWEAGAALDFLDRRNKERAERIAAAIRELGITRREL